MSNTRKKQASTDGPKCKVGDRVVAKHPVFGRWEGKIVSLNLADDDWEYEVENAPGLWTCSFEATGMWLPLLWEHEIELADKEECT